MATKSKKFNLIEVATVSKSRVGKFDGVKKYVATADIDLNYIMGGEDVTFTERPSRADLVMSREDVLFAKMKNTVKVLAGSPEVEDKIFSTGFYILTPKENISKKYLYFYLLGSEFNRQKNLYSSGATMASIGNDGLRRIKISVPVDSKGSPDIKEQERIVALLEEAEELKRNRVEADQKMTTVIPALFSEMFGAGNFAKEKVMNVVAGDRAIRTGPFGSQLHHDEFTSEGVPVLGIDNVVSNTFRWAKPRHLPVEKYEKFKRFRVYPGDVLVTIMGTVGRVCVAPEDLPECMSTKHLCVITPDTSKVNAVYLWASLLYDSNVRHQTRNVAKGAIMEGWNSTIIKRLSISLPPIKLQDQFAERVKGILALEEKQKRSTANINSLFSSLLATTFTK